MSFLVLCNHLVRVFKLYDSLYVNQILIILIKILLCAAAAICLTARYYKNKVGAVCHWATVDNKIRLRRSCADL